MEENRKEKSGSRIRSFLYGAACLVFLAIAVYSAYMSYTIFSEYKRGEDTYKEISEFAVTKESPEKEKDKEEDAWKDGCPISVDFEALWKENGDVIGWIYCEDTEVSYPVLQGATNNTYLRTLMNGEYNTAGCIFMDVSCQRDLTDLVSILYGHNMHDGSMFAIVDKYKDQKAYDEHPVYWYITPGANYRLDILAGYITPSDSPVYSLFSTKEELDEFLDRSIGESMFRASSYPDDVSHVFVLSTCDYKYEEARYILVCNTTKEEDILKTEGDTCSFMMRLLPSYTPDAGALSAPFLVSPGPAGSKILADGTRKEYIPGPGSPSVTASYIKGDEGMGGELVTTIDFSGITFQKAGTYRYFVRGNLPEEAAGHESGVRILDVHVESRDGKPAISSFSFQTE